MLLDFVCLLHVPVAFVRRRESSMDSLAGVDLSNIDEDSLRKIDYRFESDVLSLPRIVTRLKFSVGDNVVQDFRMIERHYFKGRLIKSFDFTFPFCIPKSTNTWTSEYELPPMDAALGALPHSKFVIVGEFFVAVFVLCQVFLSDLLLFCASRGP